MKPVLTLLTALLLTPLAALHAAETSSQLAKPDIVLADFEQGCGGWTVEGEAFNHPTTRSNGATRFVGKGLADSWDAERQVLKGTLTSLESTIERNFIRFLVGGQSINAGAGLQLLIDGKLEFFARGVGDRQLRPGAFDVSSFLGRKAQLVAFDGGMWDYVVVDEIIASDFAGQGARVHHPISQCITVDKQMDLAGMHYLTVPINNLAPMVDCVLAVDGKPKVDLKMCLAVDASVDFWASYPLDALNGQKLRFFTKEPAVFKGHADDFLKQVYLSAQPYEMQGIYAERGRPQLSFNPKCGGIGDPNGLCFYKGLYHLF